MIIESGTVTKVQTEGVWVKTIQQSTCGSCVARVGCGQRLLSGWLQKEDDLYIRFDPIHDPKPSVLTVGDRIEIGIEQGALVSAAMLAYGAPLLGLLAGAYLGTTLGSTLLAVLFSLFGLLSFGFLTRLLQSNWQSSYFQPTFVRKLTDSSIAISS